MKVNIVGRHVKVTRAMQDYAEEKLSRMDRYFPHIEKVDIVMDVDGLRHHVEVSLVMGRGAKLVGKAEAEEMFAAIDLAESKVRKQIRRFNSRLKDHRDRSRIGHGEGEPGDGEAPEDEETYDRVVREMLEEED
jgi:putative sigma-54 modulation protein